MTYLSPSVLMAQTSRPQKFLQQTSPARFSGEQHLPSLPSEGAKWTDGLNLKKHPILVTVIWNQLSKEKRDAMLRRPLCPTESGVRMLDSDADFVLAQKRLFCQYLLQGFVKELFDTSAWDNTKEKSNPEQVKVFNFFKKGSTYNVPQSQVTINVQYSPNLIKTLYQLFEDPEFPPGYFETPVNRMDWTQHPDQLRLYFTQPLSPHLQQKLANQLRSFGTISYEPYQAEEEAEKMLKKARAIDDDLAHELNLCLRFIKNKYRDPGDYNFNTVHKRAFEKLLSFLNEAFEECLREEAWLKTQSPRVTSPTLLPQNIVATSMPLTKEVKTYSPQIPDGQKRYKNAQDGFRLIQGKIKELGLFKESAEFENYVLRLCYDFKKGCIEKEEFYNCLTEAFADIRKLKEPQEASSKEITESELIQKAGQIDEELEKRDIIKKILKRPDIHIKDVEQLLDLLDKSLAYEA